MLSNVTTLAPSGASCGRHRSRWLEMSGAILIICQAAGRIGDSSDSDAVERELAQEARSDRDQSVVVSVVSQQAMIHVVVDDAFAGASSRDPFTCV